MLLCWFAALAVAVPDASKAMPSNLATETAELIAAALEQDEAYAELAWICDRIGARISGSPELEAAVDYTAERMAADGLKVSKEPVTVRYWERGGATLTELGDKPRNLPLLALGGSVATPVQGLTAEVLVVGSFDELTARAAEAKGRIVVYDVPFTTYGETVGYRWSGADRAAAVGAVAALVRSVTPESLHTPHTGSMGYGDDVPKIPVAAITVEDAARLRRLQDGGLTSKLTLSMTPSWGDEKTSHNVVGELRGRSRPDEVVVLACHLDSWDVGQGAHDDGAGCVVVMEALALMAARETPPQRTVRAVLYTNEENGLAGGRSYAEVHKGETIVAALESDTGAGAPLGFGLDRRDASGDKDPSASAALAEHLRVYIPLLDQVGATDWSPGYSGADIGPLVKGGTIGLGLRNDMAPYWRIHHTEADTLDKIDPVLLQKNVAAVAAMGWILAEVDSPAPPAK